MQTTENRHQTILRLARRQGSLKAQALADVLGVSVQTIRTDLRALAAAGAIERTHGGAVLPSGVRHIGYDARRQLNAGVKEHIAQVAARQIPHHASLFINIGTTTEAVARALTAHSNLMVVTNNLNVATTLAPVPSCEVHVTGGSLRRSDGALVGDNAVMVIERFKVDIAVIGTSALDLDGDLLDFDAAEVRVTQSILKQARKVILVADNSKFARQAPVRIASLAEVDLFVTDRAPPERVTHLCADAKTRLILA